MNRTSLRYVLVSNLFLYIKQIHHLYLCGGNNEYYPLVRELAWPSIAALGVSLPGKARESEERKITKSRRKLRQCRNFLHILVSAFYSAEMPKFSFGLHGKNRLGCMPQQPGTKTVDLFTKSQISTGKCSKCRLHMLA